MRNYHYYLKQEIFSHDPSSRRFRGFRWHSERPLDLYIMGDSQSLLATEKITTDMLSQTTSRRAHTSGILMPLVYQCPRTQRRWQSLMAVRYCSFRHRYTY
jgi:elongator complex protein 1